MVCVYSHSQYVFDFQHMCVMLESSQLHVVELNFRILWNITRCVLSFLNYLLMVWYNTMISF